VRGKFKHAIVEGVAIGIIGILGHLLFGGLVDLLIPFALGLAFAWYMRLNLPEIGVLAFVSGFAWALFYALVLISGNFNGNGTLTVVNQAGALFSDFFFVFALAGAGALLSLLFTKGHRRR